MLGSRLIDHPSYITTTTRSGFLLTPIRMTLNDLECPICLAVRVPDDTPVVAFRGDHG